MGDFLERKFLKETKSPMEALRMDIIDN